MTTKQALLKSIEKWEKICFDGGEDRFDENCSLCIEYIGKSCPKCPIGKITINGGCSYTPYRIWVDLTEYQGSYKRIAMTDKELDAAIQEYFFLCMLYWEYYG